MSGPVSARAFFRAPRPYVERWGAGQPVLRLRAGPKRFVVVRDPEEIGRVLVTDGATFAPGKWKQRARRFVGPTLNTLHGEEHRRRRRALQPALSRTRVGACREALARRAHEAAERWPAGERVRLRDVIDPLSVTMAGDVLLSTDLAARAGALARDLETIMTSLPRLLPPLPGTKPARALARVDETIARLVEQRRRSGAKRRDLLDALLHAGVPEATVRGELIAFLLAALAMTSLIRDRRIRAD